MQDGYSLTPQIQGQSYRVEMHETVTSTNQLALYHAQQGDQGKLWVVAEEQTQGVGRRGRIWHSPKGNLYASLLLVGNYAPAQAALLGFVAGVSMAETLVHVIGKTTGVQLKWPNDVLLNGAKFTGILVECHPLLSGKAAVIIGMGVNVVHAPPKAGYAVTSLAANGFKISPAQFFNPLAHFWAMNFDFWEGGKGFARIREKWLEFAVGLGEEMHVVRAGQRVSGVFKTIDQQGQLVIEGKGGEQTVISAGDVHFGEVATWRPEKDRGLDVESSYF